MLKLDEIREDPVVRAVADYAASLTRRDIVFRHLDDWQPTRQLAKLPSPACVRSGQRDEVYLSEMLPRHTAVHELLHIVLAEEGYVDLRFSHDDGRPSQYEHEFRQGRDDLLNKVIHAEIYRRMDAEYGLDMDIYKTNVVDELLSDFDQQISRGELTFTLGRQIHFFNVLDLFHLRPQSSSFLARYEAEHPAVHSAAVAASIAATGIGFDTPQASLDAARLFTKHVIDFGNLHGNDAENDLWRSIEWFLPKP